MNINQTIIDHYGRKGKTEVADTNQHLHIGGIKASEFVLAQMDLKADMRVLDIGCGVGGPAILAAQEYGCHVTGVDLTPAFIETANILAQQNNVEHLTDFQTTDASQLHFKDDSFDAAFMFHVGMNIQNKQPVYHEAARVLKEGSIFLIYDILALENAADMIYPCPWAKTVETSFLEDADTIKAYLDKAGFKISSIKNSQDYALSALEKMLHNTDWSTTPDRHKAMTNLHANIQSNACAPHIILAEKI